MPNMHYHKMCILSDIYTWSLCQMPIVPMPNRFIKINNLIEDNIKLIIVVPPTVGPVLGVGLYCKSF